MTSRRLSGLAQLTFGNRASQVYLGLVAAVAVFVAVDTLFVHHDDASMAGVWLYFLAAPTVFAFLMSEAVFGEAVVESAAFGYTTLLLSVLIQSAALGAFVRLLRDRPRPVHTSEA